MTESISGKGPRPPLAVWGSIAASLGTVVWIAGLTPDKNPSLTIEWGETGLAGLVFAVVVARGNYPRRQIPVGRLLPPSRCRVSA